MSDSWIPKVLCGKYSPWYILAIILTIPRDVQRTIFVEDTIQSMQIVEGQDQCFCN